MNEANQMTGNVQDDARDRSEAKSSRIEKRSPVLRVGDLELNPNTRTVHRGHVQILLNRKEFSLLEYLMLNSETAVTRGMILERVWGLEVDPLTNTVDVHVRFLRKKIDDGYKKKLIQTVHGFGYRIAA